MCLRTVDESTRKTVEAAGADVSGGQQREKVKKKQSFHCSLACYPEGQRRIPPTKPNVEPSHRQMAEAEKFFLIL